ncbi:hypothetical protein Tco_0271484 [Tanacetum coccineum]
MSTSSNNGFASFSKWILDSGATHHTSYLLSQFISLNLNSSKSIVATNGDSMPLAGIGSVDTPSVALSDVYYIPKNRRPKKKRIRGAMEDPVDKNERSLSCSSNKKKSKEKPIKEPTSGYASASSKGKAVTEYGSGFGGVCVSAFGGENHPKRERFDFDEPTQRPEVASEGSYNGSETMATPLYSASQNVQGAESGGPLKGHIGATNNGNGDGFQPWGSYAGYLTMATHASPKWRKSFINGKS